MQILPRIGQKHTRKRAAWHAVRRQAARIVAGANIQHRTVAGIPAQRMPTIGTAITRTGGQPTDTAFTSHPEKKDSGRPSLQCGSGSIERERQCGHVLASSRLSGGW